MKSTSPISRLFARSPFKPIQQHMTLVDECVAQVLPLFEALRDDDHGGVQAAIAGIVDRERKADDLKNEIRSRLPKSLLMPVDRRDLLDLLGTQDHIADAAKDVTRLIATDKLRIPAALADDLLAYVRRNIDAAHQCWTIIDQLDELLELGFRGKKADAVTDMIGELERIESDTDTQWMDLTRDLFVHEGEMGPLSVVFWYETFKKLGQIADHAEDVGDRLRLLIAR